MEYGVNVSNKFAFLSGDEDNDPAEIIAKAQSASKEKTSALKKEVKKPAVVEKKVTIAVAANSVNKENVDHRRPPRRDGPPRNGPGFERKYVRGPPAPRKTDENGEPVFEEARPPRQFNNNRPPRFNNNNNNEHNESNNNYNRGPPRRFRNDGPRPQRQENIGDSTDENNQNHQVGENRAPYSGGGGAGGRYRRNGPPQQRGDRTSGSDKTGVRSVPKKDGFGKGNWGTEQDELAGGTDATAPNADTTLNQSANETVTEHTEQADGHADDEKSEEAEQPEPVRELTLEEWKAQHKSEQPKFNTRKPGEGDEKKIYQKLVPLKRADANKNAAKDAEEVQIKREPREKALNIEVSFNGAQRNRGGPRYREDRGGYGREERGGYSDEPRSSGGFRGDDRRGPDRRPPAGGNFRAGPSGSGAGGGRRGPPNNSQFNLTPESFPALGAH